MHDGLAQRRNGGLDGPKSKTCTYMRHARHGESDRVLVRLDSSVQLRGTEFKVASRTPETVGGEQPLVAGTFDAQRKLTDIINPDDSLRAASSPGRLSRPDPIQASNRHN